MRLQHVSTPYVRGRQEDLRAFYGDLLGLEEKPVPDSLGGRELVWFAAGEGELELHFLPEQAESDERSARHFCLEVDDVETCRRTIEEAGYETREATPIPNRPRFTCRDPFGNLVEFTTIVGGYRDAG